MLDAPICRICLETAAESASEATGGGEALISPCGCRGSVKFVHASCIGRWQRLQTVAESGTCDLCSCPFDHASLPSRESSWWRTWAGHINGVWSTFVAMFQWWWSTELRISVGAIYCYWAWDCAVTTLMRQIMFGVVPFGCSVCFYWLLDCYGFHLRCARDGNLYFPWVADPLEHLTAGGLLVNLNAPPDHPFHHSIVMLLEHREGSREANRSVGVMLNGVTLPEPTVPSRRGPSPELWWHGRRVRHRTGGPVTYFWGGFIANALGFGDATADIVIHSMDFQTYPPEKLFRKIWPPRLNSDGNPRQRRPDDGKDLWVSRLIRPEALRGNPQLDDPEAPPITCLHGMVRWHAHELAAQVRRGRWGWLPPHHLKREYLCSGGSSSLETQWRMVSRDPHLERMTPPEMTPTESLLYFLEPDANV
jgi:hypothetical protein